MQLLIKSDRKVSEDGHTVLQLKKGDIVNLRHSAAIELLNANCAEKTIEQMHIEWHDALDEPKDGMRAFNIACIESSLKDDPLTLKHFHRLVAFADYQRDVVRALDSI